VLVTTRAQAKRNTNNTQDPESDLNSLENTTILAEESTSKGETNTDSVGSVEMEDPELRREEPPSAEPQDSDPLQANVDDVL